MVVNGTGLIPYYTWNVTDGMYSNVFYGANFVDYVGKVEKKLTMVRPANGQQYDSYIMGYYFDLTINGTNAADSTTLAAINAIKAIPERVSYEQRDLVEAARAAYDKIATIEQQAQVGNYADLISAEQRIKSLTPEAETPVEEPVEQEKEKIGYGWIVGVFVVLVGIAAMVGAMVLRKDKGEEAQDSDDQAEPQETTEEEEIREIPEEEETQESASEEE